MLALSLAGTVALSTLAATHRVPQKLHGRDDAPSWQAFVRAPQSSTITPAAIVDNSVVGNVSNANGLLAGGSGPTVLARQESDADAPCLAIDFGQNSVGLLSIDFGGSQQASSASGTQRPGITVAFSETLQFLTNTSDFTRSQNAGGGVCISSWS